MSQLVKSVDEIYLAAIRNRVTGQLPADIHTIMQYLFNIYGKIKPEYLLERKPEVENFILSLAGPVDTIWNKIEDIAELAELAQRPFTEQ